MWQDASTEKLDKTSDLLPEPPEILRNAYRKGKLEKRRIDQEKRRGTG